MKEKPQEYMKLFDRAPVYKRCRYDSSTGLETVLYTTNTGAIAFIAYDKTIEARKNSVPIPPLFSGGKVLRLEYKLTKRRGIKEKFDRDLTAHDLYEHDVYRKLQSLFYDFYRSIPKRGRKCFVDVHEGVTPAGMETLCAEQYRQTYPQDYANTLQSLRQRGAITEKNYERIRAKNKQRDNNTAMSFKNPLIEELDDAVRRHALEGA